MMHKITFALVSILFCACFIQPVYAQVKLPRLVRDSMVLQRDAKINVWGWASPKEKVIIRFNGKAVKTTAGADGKWLIPLPPMKAGGPYTMEISGKNKITLHDILIGEVWLISGQSNMVTPIERVKEKYPEEVANANNPMIRHFFIPTYTDLQKPWEDLPTGYWKSAVPKDIMLFSSVGYFFAKVIYEKYHVAVGLINASVGGPPIEAWTSEEGLKDFPNAIITIQKLKDTSYVNSTNRAAFAAGRNNRPVRQNDKGLTGPKPWYDTSYVPKGWRNMNIPGYWADQGIRGLNGVVWFRREIDVPASMTGIPAKLFMGTIVDADFVYVNGKLAGNITYQYPPRRYDMPAGMLKPGKNIIVVRVINNAGKGGFIPDKPYYLTAGGQNIDLKGTWQYKVGEVYAPARFGGGGGGPRPISAQDQPTALYNAMVAPLINYTIKGFLWYQGEGNTGRPAEYRKSLPALIADWRKLWKEGDIPFLFIQLPNFGDMQYTPSESNWAILRESQMKGGLSAPNTAMAVTIDLGEWNDLHPVSKKPMGERLALAALHLAYGEKDIVYSGPLYQSSKIDGNKIIITFNNTGSGMISIDGEELSQFAIAGADKKFVWANAKIEGNTVIVWSDEIKQPAFVRYAWSDNPDGANLYNKEGLPASPFRTDE